MSEPFVILGACGFVGLLVLIDRQLRPEPMYPETQEDAELARHNQATDHERRMRQASTMLVKCYGPVKCPACGERLARRRDVAYFECKNRHQVE